MKPTVFLFGEAQKGDFCKPYLCKSLSQLADTFGHPPMDTMGLFFAIQTLLFEKELIFFRVKEEGFSLDEYKKGLRLLNIKEAIPSLSAIYVPGIGDSEIISEASDVCHLHKSLLVITEKDLYDYLTTKL